MYSFYTIPSDYVFTYLFTLPARLLSILDIKHAGREIDNRLGTEGT